MPPGFSLPTTLSVVGWSPGEGLRQTGDILDPGGCHPLGYEGYSVHPRRYPGLKFPVPRTIDLAEEIVRERETMYMVSISVCHVVYFDL